MRKIKKACSVYTCALAALLTSACMSDSEIAMASKVVTTTDAGVKNCIFLGDVDSQARITLYNAREDLRYKASLLGATHLVEMFVYTAQIGIGKDYGPAISGRAYKCTATGAPEKTDVLSLLEYNYEMPNCHEPEFF